MEIVAPLPRSRRGNRYILTVQCNLTNRADVFAMSNQRATTSGKVLVRNWIFRSGVPDSFQSDQGRNFESKTFSFQQAYADKCFLHLEKVAGNLKWPTDDWVIQSQSVLVGKARNI